MDRLSSRRPELLGPRHGCGAGHRPSCFATLSGQWRFFGGASHRRGRPGLGHCRATKRTSHSSEQGTGAGAATWVRAPLRLRLHACCAPGHRRHHAVPGPGQAGSKPQAEGGTQPQPPRRRCPLPLPPPAPGAPKARGLGRAGAGVARRLPFKSHFKGEAEFVDGPNTYPPGTSRAHSYTQWHILSGTGSGASWRSRVSELASEP
jgi:hypothetical protein